MSLLSTPTQAQRFFANSLAPYPAFIGGFGSGKTHAAILRAMRLKTTYRKQNIGYYLPTYDLVRTIAFPRFEEFLTEAQIPYQLNKSDATINFQDCGQIIFRTMDKPERIIGYEVAHSILDELDTLPVEKAKDVWIKVLGRNRQKCGAINSAAVATTPEGYRYVYQTWGKNPKPGYKTYRARTVENLHLPEGYVDSLKAIYPAPLLAAYLEGLFVNMTSGSIYTEFDRVRNNCSTKEVPREPLHIGMDFNVGKMAAVIHVVRGGRPHAVGEEFELLDTPAMILQLKKRYPEHSIFVYPDASGGNRKSNNASQSDLTLLRSAGFHVCANASNPAVKDRILSMNAALMTGYFVNVEACPHYAESLEQQAYDKNGEPDKTNNFDHLNDAGGYFITYRYPVVRRSATIQTLSS